MRFVPSLVVLGIAGACALPSTDEFASGPPKGPGAGDGGLIEAAAVLEAGPTDASDEDEAAAGGCPAGAFYCNDFSSGTASDVGERIAVDPGGKLAIENGELLAFLPALPEAGYYEATAFKNLPAEALKLRVEVDVNVAEAPWDGGNMIILAFDLDGQPASSVEVYINANSVSVTTSRGSGELLIDDASRDIARTQRVRVKLEVDFTPQTGSHRLYFDDMLVDSRNEIAFVASSNRKPSLRLGMTRNNRPTPALTVRYDNLAVTVL